jgi:streptogramin lyase
VLKNLLIVRPQSLACAAAFFAFLLAGCSAAGTQSVPSGPAILQQTVREDATLGKTPQGLRAEKKSRIIFSPSVLALFGTGKSKAGSVVVSEAGYRGRFATASNCAQVASVKPATGKGPAFTVEGIPLHPGSCAITFRDAHHNTARLRVSVGKVAGRLKFSIDVPARTALHHRSNGNVAPSYVSPFTQAITIAVTNSPGGSNASDTVGVPETVTLGLNALSNDCTTQFGELTCTVTLDLAPCASSSGSSGNCYSANVTAYDAFDSPSNTVPDGAAVLSIADDISFAVTANQTSNVSFAMSAVPAKVVVSAVDTSSTVSGQYIQLTGLGAHPFFVNAYDADGNLITGLGAPNFSVTASPAPAITLNTPPPGSPRFSVTPLTRAAHYSATVQLILSATYPAGETDACAQDGVICQTQYTMTVPPPVTNYPVGGNDTGITVGPDGNLWYADYGNGAVGKITTAGAATEYSSGIPFNNKPVDIVAGPDGNLWFTEKGNAVGMITTAGVVTQYTVDQWQYGFPNQMTVGPDGRLWWTEGDNSIGAITTAGTATLYSAGISPPANGGTGDLGGITTGPDGNLWFTNQTVGQIGKITTAGVVTEYSSGITSEPMAIVTGPNGNLWFTESSDTRIGEITTSGVVTEHSLGTSGGYGTSIIVGPDGNLWTSAGGGTLSRITPAGVVTQFPSVGGAIVVGPDGNIWFANNTCGIGKLQL